jgi:hypothetical protein
LSAISLIPKIGLSIYIAYYYIGIQIALHALFRMMVVATLFVRAPLIDSEWKNQISPNLKYGGRESPRRSVIFSSETMRHKQLNIQHTALDRQAGSGIEIETESGTGLRSGERCRPIPIWTFTKHR